jgi:NitT/TauT family transport system substrate-binding protein
MNVRRYRAMEVACITNLCLILTIVLYGCKAATQTRTATSEPRQVTLAMGYIPNVQFTPVYVAVDKGYFADENLTIEFDYGMENDLLKLVGADERQFVIGSGDQVILARNQGLPVVYVLNWYRRFPVAVAALKPLQSPQDLVGKTVGVPGLYGASYIGWQALLSAAGIQANDVDLVSIGYTQVESMVAGQVDAAVVYAMNEPVQLRQQGYEVSVIEVADYVDFVSNGLITNERTIGEDPELVRSVVRAIARGLADTLKDPDDAFAVCRRYVPAIDDASASLQRAVLQEALGFWRADKLGRSDPAAWKASVDLMRQIGMIEQELDPSTCYTNEFVP